MALKTRSRNRTKRGGKQRTRTRSKSRTRSRRYRKTSRRTRSKSYRGGSIEDLEQYLLNEPVNRNNAILADRDIRGRIIDVAAFAYLFNDDHKYDDLMREIRTLFGKYGITQGDVDGVQTDYDEYLYNYDERRSIEPIMEAFNTSNGYLFK